MTLVVQVTTWWLLMPFGNHLGSWRLLSPCWHMPLAIEPDHIKEISNVKHFDSFVGPTLCSSTIHFYIIITKTSKWARRCLKSPHDRLLERLFRRRSKKTSNSAWLAFVRGIHRWPVNSPHKGPVTRKMFSFDDVIVCFFQHQRWPLAASYASPSTKDLGCHSSS